MMTLGKGGEPIFEKGKAKVRKEMRRGVLAREF